MVWGECVDARSSVATTVPLRAGWGGAVLTMEEEAVLV